MTDCRAFAFTWWRLVLSGLFTSSTQAFAPASIRWGGITGKGFVLAPAPTHQWSLRGDQRQKLIVVDAPGDISSSYVPRFVVRLDGTIALDGKNLCIEATDGVERSAQLSRCSGGAYQRWNWLPWGPIQLSGTNQCLKVVDTDGDLHRAVVQLRECDHEKSESWTFEASLPMLRQSESAAYMRHATRYFANLILVGVLGFSVWLWRWRSTTRASPTPLSQADILIGAESGGISLIGPCNMHQTCGAMARTVRAKSARAGSVATKKDEDNSLEDAVCSINVSHVPAVMALSAKSPTSVVIDDDEKLCDGPLDGTAASAMQDKVARSQYVKTPIPNFLRSEPVAAYWKRDGESHLSRRLTKIIESTPSLSKPEYRPTPWARGSKANFALATLRSRLGAARHRLDPPLRGTFTQCEDPDVVVEWAKDPAAFLLPDNAPIVAFLHTITGTAGQTRWLKKYASSRGWRSCTFVRRGHGGPLRSASFNMLGAVEDVEMQLAAVRETYPQASFIAMIGVSAGSAQLLSYLGRAGSLTPVGAACSICPAWDVQSAFAKLGATQPFVERAMLRGVQDTFLRGPNEMVLRAWDNDAFERCCAATSLPELVNSHAPFAMRDRMATADDYYRAHDPMADRRGVSVPTLLINAEDDFVCRSTLVRPEIIANEQPGTLLLVTRSGSHVAFNEGFLARDSFHMRVSFDFLDAALATSRGSYEAAENGDLSLTKGVPVPLSRSLGKAMERTNGKVLVETR